LTLRSGIFYSLKTWLLSLYPGQPSLIPVSGILTIVTQCVLDIILDPAFARDLLCAMPNWLNFSLGVGSQSYYGGQRHIHDATIGIVGLQGFLGPGIAALGTNLIKCDLAVNMLNALNKQGSFP
jgi:hypothetical protein